MQGWVHRCDEVQKSLLHPMQEAVRQRRQRMQEGMQNCHLWITSCRRHQRWWSSLPVQGMQDQMQTYHEEVLGRQLHNWVPNKALQETERLQSLPQDQLRWPLGRGRRRRWASGINLWIKIHCVRACKASWLALNMPNAPIQHFSFWSTVAIILRELIFRILFYVPCDWCVVDFFYWLFTSN